MTHTRTFAKLVVSALAYDEIEAKLRAADYGHSFIQQGEETIIDMHGIGLAREDTRPEETAAYGALREATIEAMRVLDHEYKRLVVTRICLPPKLFTLVRRYERRVDPKTFLGRTVVVGRDARVETDAEFGRWRPIDLSKLPEGWRE